MMKPLPYVVLSKVDRPFSFPLIVQLKVHDCLEKVHKFLTKNDDQFKCALVWKGKNHLEIFAKVRPTIQIEYLNDKDKVIHVTNNNVGAECGWRRVRGSSCIPFHSM